MIKEGEEEVECNYANVDLNTKEFVAKKDKHKKYITKFCNIGNKEIKNARKFTLKDTTNEIVQDILLDGESIQQNEINTNSETQKKIIEVDKNTNLNENFSIIFSLVLKDILN